MASEQGPHHSKSGDTPVTIDPQADEAPLAAPDSEALTDSQNGEAASASVDEAAAPVEAESQPLTEAEGARAADAATEAQVQATSEEPPEKQTPAVSQVVESRPRQAPVSSLVAAGIAGGLVALACAAAIQYAGFLPGSGAKDESAEIATLSADLDGLKQTVANLPATPPPKTDDTLVTRVTALETAAKKAPPVAAAAAGAGDAAASQQIADLRAQVEGLTASLARAEAQQAAASADISKRLGDAEGKLGDPRQETFVARAIAAAALKAAIDRGGPFQPELDTFASVAPDDPAVADLRNFAQTGIPSRADLIKRASQVANDIVAAAATPEDSASWSDRLLSGAKSLVKVRPVGNVEGNSVDAIAARIEDKVRNGDLPGAVTEWNSLPEAGKSASAAFKQSLEARIRVEDLVSDALSKAIAGTAKQS